MDLLSKIELNRTVNSSVRLESQEHGSLLDGMGTDDATEPQGYEDCSLLRRVSR